MSNSVMYAGSNDTQATLSTGTIVGFNNIVRRYGNDIGLSGGNVVVTQGYFDVDTNISFTAGGAGTVVVSIYKDGVLVPYATQSFLVADTVSYAINVPCVIRQKCCCESTITVVVSGVATSVTNASIKVERL